MLSKIDKLPQNIGESLSGIANTLNNNKNLSSYKVFSLKMDFNALDKDSIISSVNYT